MNNSQSPLAEDKKKQILMAALREFAEKGYQNSSTNLIIRGAGVSKGLLFHYYDNKKNLYLSVLDMCLDFFLTYLDEELKSISTDITERLIDINVAKLKMSAQEPLMQKLVTAAFLNPPPQLEKELRTRQNTLYTKYLPHINENIDRTLFKDGVDQNKAVELVMIVVNALGEKYLQIYQERIQMLQSDNPQMVKKSASGYQDLMESFLQELKDYLGMLKYGIYKPID